METMRELLAVFMLTKASENVLFYRSQGNAARVGLTGPTVWHMGRPVPRVFPEPK